ncbi:MAG TPA: cyclic nucleotide-binding domain-containing protein [Candidatus Binatia bacterium]|jgi:CRP-like cAMP-binding protein|nr:cyclic nucleotide-binding domain-containing protein [Candidatus Binatia bacterium]
MAPNELLKEFYLVRMAAGDDPMEPRILGTILDALAERCSFDAGATIFREGETADAMYVVEIGTVEVFRTDADPADGDTGIATLGPGEEFGEMAFFDEGPRSATAKAGTECSILRVPYASLREELRKRPSIAALLYRNAAAFMARRLRETSRDLAMASGRIRAH